ncbi:Resolvase, N-terminal domain protein [Ketogulonicigenium vulgare WSH-001]|uniref:Resolvase, N-terminal domain protein n=2 Tax=Ketogulonicigenium vulgare TaxID=92945 RepID=F9Y4P3_KETVW|nr:Resolvase, N-terminal domain protein [Ketogulonicigenium vulgare WSH-001]
MHVMMRRVMTLFDEYQSRENGKHTLRAMKENARQGFWNGALPPIGYRIVEAERRGAKVKKTLAIDPMHADTVRLIYRLALSGDGTTGPMGVKAIVGYLNDRSIFTRDGGRWGVGPIHAILTRTTYVGQHRFNRRGKDRTRKADDEVITLAVPPLIDQATFNAVQTLLRDRNPKTLLPHLVSSPNMLTGLLHCAQCGGLMTMRTGKAGRYRYYACQKTARTDTARCTGIAIPIDALDTLVARHMMERLLDRKRIERILTMILERRQALIARDGAGRLDELNRCAEEAKLRLQRLRKGIEMGALDIDDPSLQERLTYLRALQARTAEETASLQAELDRAGIVTVSASMLSAVIETAGQRLLERGDGFRRGYASAFTGRIVAEPDKVRITCTKS